ncbi:small nuclear ribonucleoprotein E-like [Podarcis raffonei]|uniref:small nuclear ribonucleoprotein E-like n=1 Tax=Podarcis raffonei TaxID=65483 RepID=UPI0023290C22|nr:small nuclear ribonucleoprotein E-like [Podarcis raffonei]
MSVSQFTLPAPRKHRRACLCVAPITGKTITVGEFSFREKGGLILLGVVHSPAAGHGQGQKVQKVIVQPINLIFRYLQNRSRIQVWLYEQVNMRIEGCIIGFDEYMNLVLDDAEEIHSSRKQLSRIMLKGDNIPLLQSVSN